MADSTSRGGGNSANNSGSCLKKTETILFNDTSYNYCRRYVISFHRLSESNQLLSSSLLPAMKRRLIAKALGVGLELAEQHFKIGFTAEKVREDEVAVEGEENLVIICKREKKGGGSDEFWITPDQHETLFGLLMIMIEEEASLVPLSQVDFVFSANFSDGADMGVGLPMVNAKVKGQSGEIDDDAAVVTQNAKIQVSAHALFALENNDVTAKGDPIPSLRPISKSDFIPFNKFRRIISANDEKIKSKEHLKTIVSRAKEEMRDIYIELGPITSFDECNKELKTKKSKTMATTPSVAEAKEEAEGTEMPQQKQKSLPSPAEPKTNIPTVDSTRQTKSSKSRAAKSQPSQPSEPSAAPAAKSPSKGTPQGFVTPSEAKAQAKGVARDSKNGAPGFGDDYGADSDYDKALSELAGSGSRDNDYDEEDGEEAAPRRKDQYQKDDEEDEYLDKSFRYFASTKHLNVKQRGIPEEDICRTIHKFINNTSKAEFAKFARNNKSYTKLTDKVFKGGTKDQNKRREKILKTWKNKMYQDNFVLAKSIRQPGAHTTQSQGAIRDTARDAVPLGGSIPRKAKKVTDVARPFSAGASSSDALTSLHASSTYQPGQRYASKSASRNPNNNPNNIPRKPSPDPNSPTLAKPHWPEPTPDREPTLNREFELTFDNSTPKMGMTVNIAKYDGDLAGVILSKMEVSSQGARQIREKDYSVEYGTFQSNEGEEYFSNAWLTHCKLSHQDHWEEIRPSKKIYSKQLTKMWKDDVHKGHLKMVIKFSIRGFPNKFGDRDLPVPPESLPRSEPSIAVARKPAASSFSQYQTKWNNEDDRYMQFAIVLNEMLWNDPRLDQGIHSREVIGEVGKRIPRVVDHLQDNGNFNRAMKYAKKVWACLDGKGLITKSSIKNNEKFIKKRDMWLNEQQARQYQGGGQQGFVAPQNQYQQQPPAPQHRQWENSNHQNRRQYQREANSSSGGGSHCQPSPQNSPSYEESADTYEPPKHPKGFKPVPLRNPPDLRTSKPKNGLLCTSDSSQARTIHKRKVGFHHPNKNTCVITAPYIDPDSSLQHVVVASGSWDEEKLRFRVFPNNKGPHEEPSGFGVRAMQIKAMRNNLSSHELVDCSERIVQCSSEIGCENANASKRGILVHCAACGLCKKCCSGKEGKFEVLCPKSRGSNSKRAVYSYPQFKVMGTQMGQAIRTAFGRKQVQKFNESGVMCQMEINDNPLNLLDNKFGWLSCNLSMAKLGLVNIIDRNQDGLTTGADLVELPSDFGPALALIQNEPSLANYVTKFEETLLHAAALTGRLDVIKKLIAEPYYCDPFRTMSQRANYTTPKALAEEGRRKILNRKAEEAAALGVSAETERRVEEYNKTWEYLDNLETFDNAVTNALKNAVHDSHAANTSLKMIVDLMKEGKLDVNQPRLRKTNEGDDVAGGTLLHVASECGVIDIVRILVEELGVDVGARDNLGRDAVDAASTVVFAEGLQSLLDLNAKEARKRRQETEAEAEGGGGKRQKTPEEQDKESDMDISVTWSPAKLRTQREVSVVYQLAVGTPLREAKAQFKVGVDENSGKVSLQALHACRTCDTFANCGKCRYGHNCDRRHVIVGGEEGADKLCFDKDENAANKIFQILEAEYARTDPRLRGVELTGNFVVEMMEVRRFQHFSACFICPLSGVKYLSPKNSNGGRQEENFGCMWHKSEVEAKRAAAWLAWDRINKYGVQEPNLATGGGGGGGGG